jgi:putative ABC transport system permease protein
MFAKHPGFTAIAVMSIAFGTGANVAMFSTADALLLRPLPVARPSELVTVGSRIRRAVFVANLMSYPDYVDVRERARSFTGLLAYQSVPVGFAPRAGVAPQVRVASFVSSNFFQTLGVEPEIGRAFRPEEERVQGRDSVAILAYGTWVSVFAADPRVLGRKVRIGGLDFAIVGVAPERFTGLNARYVHETVFLPVAMMPRVTPAPVDPLTHRDVRILTVKGRLRPGVGIGEARAELAAIGAALAHAYPDTNHDQALTAETEFQVRFERNPLDNGLLILLTTLSTAVLCVACANVAGLLASRAPVRAREISLRLALGASRARLVRQLVTESLAVAVAGGFGGLLVGFLGISLLRQIDYPTDVISVPSIQIDRRTFTFSLVVAVASAFLFGLGPALQTTRNHLSNTLKTGDAGGVRRRLPTGRSALVSLQVALSLVLLTISVFAYQVFSRELTRGPGFQTTHIAKMTLDPGQARYTTAQIVRFFERAVDGAARLPGAHGATVTSAMPLFSFATQAIVPERFRLPAGQKHVQSLANTVDEHYFDLLGIPIVEGRGFRPSDDGDSMRVAIVNETFARHYWPGQDALGKRFRLEDAAGPMVEIVGVAKTATYGYVTEPPQDMIYFTYRQLPRPNMVLLAATDGDSAAMLRPLSDMAASLDAEVPHYDVQTMEVFYAARVTTIGKVVTRMIGGMGLMGMTLTTIGLYGLVSYAVSRRTREIGIRMAIGATRRAVLTMVLRQGMMPAWFGVAAGLGLSAETNRLLPSIMPVTSRLDPRTFLLVMPVLVAVVLVAAFIPARRASLVNPTVALRCE